MFRVASRATSAKVTNPDPLEKVIFFSFRDTFAGRLMFFLLLVVHRHSSGSQEEARSCGVVAIRGKELTFFFTILCFTANVR